MITIESTGIIDGRIKFIMLHYKLGRIGKRMKLKVDLEYKDQTEDELIEMIEEQVDFEPIEKELQGYLDEKPAERLVPTEVEENGRKSMRFRSPKFEDEGNRVE